jgi:hypothetical protein
MFTNHNSNGDSLYGADISTHPKHRHEGIGGMLYEARKELADPKFKKDDCRREIIQLQ